MVSRMKQRKMGWRVLLTLKDGQKIQQVVTPGRYSILKRKVASEM